MSSKKTIKPSYWQSGILGPCSRDTCLNFFKVPQIRMLLIHSQDIERMARARFAEVWLGGVYLTSGVRGSMGQISFFYHLVQSISRPRCAWGKLPNHELMPRMVLYSSRLWYGKQLPANYCDFWFCMCIDCLWDTPSAQADEAQPMC